MEPTTLFLFSDEPLTWLTEDVDFYFKWTKLLPRILHHGHKVVLVHAVDNELSGIELRQSHRNKSVSKRTRSACYENYFVVEHELISFWDCLRGGDLNAARVEAFR